MPVRSDELAALPWTTMPEMIRARAVQLGAADAVVDGQVRLSWQELYDTAARLADALGRRGIREGDRVAIWAPNSWHWPVVACATWLSGATLVPISTRFGIFEVGEILQRSETALLFVPQRFLDVDYCDLLVSSFGRGERRPLRGLDRISTLCVFGAAATVPPWAVAFDELVAEGDAVPHPSPRVDSDNLAELLFTSGTTGQPKGVKLHQSALLRSYWSYGTTAGLEVGDRYLAILPFGHGGGLNGCLFTSLLHGLTNVPTAVFDPEDALATIQRERITTIVGPPAMYNALFTHADFASYDLSTLRVAFIGAATVPPKQIEDLRAIGVENVINAYGCIETCVVSMTRRDDPVDVIVHTAGRALPGVEVKVVDDEGRTVPPGELGELCARGHGIMQGYLDAEQTARAIDADHWFHTGDIAFIDDGGNIKIVDRRADMFHVGGFNVYPAEVESFLLRHPDVAAVSVVGRPHERLGHSGVAFVVARHGHSVTSSALTTWAKGKMANYKIPHEFVFVEQLPLNPTGKVDKIRLREMVKATYGNR